MIGVCGSVLQILSQFQTKICNYILQLVQHKHNNIVVLGVSSDISVFIIFGFFWFGTN